ncbi:MAG: hypothetical protein U9Q69_06225 [Nanoarchaeota archaeon]|nr:hypothetical protein [Nanoarchaeota archaeon]
MALKKFFKRKLETILLAAAFLTCNISCEEQILPKLEQRLKIPAKKNNQQDKYAVIIAGGDRDDFILDTICTYRTLRAIGFKRENIYVLDRLGSSIYVEEDGNKYVISKEFKESMDYHSDGLATEENVRKVFSYLAKKIDKDDMLYVGLTSHGEMLNGDGLPIWVYNGNEKRFAESSAITFIDNYMSAESLKYILDRIHSRTTIVLADTCYGAYFAKKFSHGRYVGMSANSLWELAFGSSVTSYTRSFFRAFEDSSRSDKNKDGLISIQEAFDYVLKNNFYVKVKDMKPQLESEKNLDKLYLEE